MKRIGTLLLTLLLYGLSVPRCGATVYHSNGSAASVQALHNAALNGDTITLPAGTFTWSTGVALTKAITLQGAETGSTVVRDAVQTGRFLEWDLRGTSNGAARLTGITFQDGGRTQTAGSPGGVLGIIGSNINGTTFRLDHCAMSNLNGVMVFNTVIGVVDHNSATQTRFGTLFAILDSYWNGDPLEKGDRSWAAPTNFGSSEFLFFEDNTATTNATTPAYLVDSYSGGRFVLRHNQIVFCKVAAHGTESTGRFRGARAYEIYRNRFIAPRNPQTNGLGLTRSGVVLLHHNSFSGWSPQGYGTAFFSLSCFRVIASFSIWPGADGRSVWDVNSGPFYTGTAARANVGSTVTVSGSPNWTPNQWRNYTIRRLSNVCNSNSYTFGLITSNTSNTITYKSGTGDPHDSPPLTFCAGDSLQIRKVDQALDQPGRARGSLVTGIPPVPPVGWNDQVTEPCYSWGNLDEYGANVGFHANVGVIRAGEHFFNHTPMPGYTEFVYPHPLTTAGDPMPTDFNNDGKPDLLLNNPTTHQTSVWYLDNNVRIGSAYGPTLWPGWNVAGVADFNGDGHPDYLLFRPDTGQTAMWYLNDSVRIGHSFGPTLWPGWNVAGVADFNGDGNRDYLLYNPSTGQTAIWYLNNNVRISSAFGPTLWPGWNVADVADFNGDGHSDYLLFNPSTGLTAIWYLNNNVRISSAFGPTLWPSWRLVAP